MTVLEGGPLDGLDATLVRPEEGDRYVGLPVSPVAKQVRWLAWKGKSAPGVAGHVLVWDVAEGPGYPGTWYEIVWATDGEAFRLIWVPSKPE